MGDDNKNISHGAIYKGKKKNLKGLKRAKSKKDESLNAYSKFGSTMLWGESVQEQSVPRILENYSNPLSQIRVLRSLGYSVPFEQDEIDELKKLSNRNTNPDYIANSEFAQDYFRDYLTTTKQMNFMRPKGKKYKPWEKLDLEYSNIYSLYTGFNWVRGNEVSEKEYKSKIRGSVTIGPYIPQDSQWGFNVHNHETYNGPSDADLSFSWQFGAQYIVHPNGDVISYDDKKVLHKWKQLASNKFDKGGYTGNEMGLAHPYEMVMNPSATQKYYTALENMNKEGRGINNNNADYNTNYDESEEPTFSQKVENIMGWPYRQIEKWGIVKKHYVNYDDDEKESNDGWLSWPHRKLEENGIKIGNPFSIFDIQNFGYKDWEHFKDDPFFRRGKKHLGWREFAEQIDDDIKEDIVIGQTLGKIPFIGPILEFYSASKTGIHIANQFLPELPELPESEDNLTTLTNSVIQNNLQDKPREYYEEQYKQIEEEYKREEEKPKNKRKKKVPQSYKVAPGIYQVGDKFDKGGYTGSKTGIVHPHEMVMNPAATQKYFNMLEKMNDEGRGEVGIKTSAFQAKDIPSISNLKSHKAISSIFNKDKQLKAYPISDNASIAMGASVTKASNAGIYSNNNGQGFGQQRGYGSAPYDINVNLFATLEQGINLTTDNVNPRVIIK
ncbi:MAG: hypothetical protein EHM58_00465 [Ignavibacteriae bacterium]|nr:MAG: hypothetical protein EHM58_00465 [Ignavibacteriota bacterium]